MRKEVWGKAGETCSTRRSRRLSRSATRDHNEEERRSSKCPEKKKPSVANASDNSQEDAHRGNHIASREAGKYGRRHHARKLAGADASARPVATSPP